MSDVAGCACVRTTVSANSPANQDVHPSKTVNEYLQ